MNKEQILSDNNTAKSSNGVTSPILSNNLLSKVNSLTLNNYSNSLNNPQSKSYATEKEKL